MPADIESDTVNGSPAQAIHRGAPVPFYAQLAEILREQIAQSTFAPGDPLPSEAELCAAYSLSRTVVRQALNELVAEGLVQKEKGRGSFVAKPKLADFVVQELRGFFDEMVARGTHVGSRILSQAVVPASQRIAHDIGIDDGADVVHIARVRTANGDPIVKVDSYLPLPRFERLAQIELSSRSLYDTLAAEFGVTPRGGWRRIEVATASRELADALGVDIGAPMLEMTAVTTDTSGQAFEYFHAYYRGDRTSFEVRV